MKYIIVDKNMPDYMVDKLKVFPYEIVKTIENKNMPQGINTHPDMLIYGLENGDILVDRDNYKYYKDIFTDRKVIKTDKSLGYLYKDHVGLNGFYYKGYFIGNLKFIDKNILNFYQENKVSLIDVKQAYAKCNTLVTDNFLVSSDMSIYKACKDIFELIKINHKEIKLRGFNYGFIGGCSGYIDNKLILTGDISLHSSGQEIIDACRRYNIEIINLSENMLEDFGSILFV